MHLGRVWGFSSGIIAVLFFLQEGISFWESVLSSQIGEPQKKKVVSTSIVPRVGKRVTASVATRPESLRTHFMPLTHKTVDTCTHNTTPARHPHFFGFFFLGQITLGINMCRISFPECNKRAHIASRPAPRGRSPAQEDTDYDYVR